MPASTVAESRTPANIGFPLLFALLLGCAFSPSLSAQSYGWGDLIAGGEAERYLRTLQVAGKAESYPWSIRRFSAREAELLAPIGEHPWQGRVGLEGGAEASLAVVSPRVHSTFNSAFPHGGGDGAHWAGRGLAASLQGGGSARWGVLSATFVPVVLLAQNATVELVPHAVSDEFPYSDWRRPTQIDLPQRFGDAPFGRLDLGDSGVRLDAFGVALGVGTGPQVWGPAVDHNLILSANASGFGHAFLGTSRPLDLGIGRVHGRFVWGRLHQSAYAPTHPDSAVRFMAGVVAVFTPALMGGLELGAARFFHQPWPEGGVRPFHLSRPLEVMTKAAFYNPSGEELLWSASSNQLASIFFRWVPPQSGFEVYGEFATEDHRHNLRDLALEPDHDTGYTLGFRRVWTRSPHRLVALRGEVVNAEPSTLQRRRDQAPFYAHADQRQGHTHRGQLLGSPAAFGGAGSILAVDRYDPAGRTTVSWSRALRQEHRRFLETGVEVRPDVIHSLGAERLHFFGRWELGVGMHAVHNFNRAFQESDIFNLHATFSMRAAF